MRVSDDAEGEATGVQTAAAEAGATGRAAMLDVSFFSRAAASCNTRVGQWTMDNPQNFAAYVKRSVRCGGRRETAAWHGAFPTRNP